MADKWVVLSVDVSKSGDEQPVNFRPRTAYPLTDVVAITQVCVMGAIV